MITKMMLVIPIQPKIQKTGKIAQITKDINLTKEKMERDDIEKAAKDYSIGKTHFRRSVLKEMDADDYVLRKDNCREDFIAGAEWRINSVWHNAITDIPEAYFPVLVEDDLEDFEVSMLALVEECPKNWRRWAYIDDLCLMRRTEL